jgi:hypothetical protein
MEKIAAANISVTARRSFGVDIDAACGQLYAKYAPKKKPQQGPPIKAANVETKQKSANV